MSAPRCVVPNRTYLITRRCSERRFFLRPDPEVVQIFEYILALSCARFGVELHAFVCMSNHYHLVVTDRKGLLPAFAQHLNSLLARSINCFRGRWESLWDRRSYSAVQLADEGAVLDKLAYALANPVRARLVGRARAWGGATSARMCFGHKRGVKRPDRFFREDMPEEATLELVAPSGEASGAALQRTVGELVGKIEAELRASGPKPMGMRRVLGQDWGGSPDTREPRRTLSPRFAARSSQIRVAAILEYRRWLEAYRAALVEFRGGLRGVVWPAGTYWMCSVLGCPRAT